MQDDSTALVVLDQEVLEPGERTLEELAALAVREHSCVHESLSAAVSHAVACGEAILEAYRRIDEANTLKWEDWASENLPFGQHQASNYMRLAFYKDRLPAEIFAPFRHSASLHNPAGGARMPSVNRALHYVRGLPPIFDSTRKARLPNEVRSEVKRLARQGLTQRDIANMMGISNAAVHRISNPSAHKRYLKQSSERRRLLAAAKRALREQEKRNIRDREAREVGGALAETYALVRKASQKADHALMQAANADARAALKEAANRLFQAEDAIAKALRAAS